jgi:hypothetical protein
MDYDKYLLQKADVNVELQFLKDICTAVLTELHKLCNLFDDDLRKVIRDSKLGADIGNIVCGYINYPKRIIRLYKNMWFFDKENLIYIADHNYKAILKFLETSPGLCEATIYELIFIINEHHQFNNQRDLEILVQKLIEEMTSPESMEIINDVIY